MRSTFMFQVFRIFRQYCGSYEGCARAYIGAVDGANIIKLHREKAQISYLSYPDFDKDPHPVLAASMVVPLQTFQIQYRDYRESRNPPILHRKEEFIPTDHPSYQKFTKLTRQEEKLGLYEDTATIGTQEGWERVLEGRGVRFSGHRLVCKSLSMGEKYEGFTPNNSV